MRRAWVAALLLLGACTAQLQPYRPGEDHELAIGPDTMLAEDGVMLPLRTWLPKGKPKAVIVALHGFNDYSNAYEGAGAFFSAHGVAVVAYDQRGFGHGPRIGVWAGEENLVRDAKQCVREVMRRYPQVPVYLLGESMGGAVAVSAEADADFPAVKGVILSSPALWGKGHMSGLYRMVLWFGAGIIPGHELTGGDLRILASNNLPMLWRMAYDPLVIKRTRIDTINGLVGLMDSAYDKVPQVHVPVLLLYGMKDQVIPPQPIDQALTRFTVPVRFAYYPDGYHMLFRDIQGRMVLEDMLHWIETPEEELPSGYGRDVP